MEGFLKDLRFALRMMIKSPGMTAVAVASLAVGLAANVTIFSFVNAIFFKGIQVEKPEELLMVVGTDAKQGPGGFNTVSRPNFEDYRDRNQVFDSLINIAFTGASLQQGGEAEPRQIFMQFVSGSHFKTLGAQPAAGRFFLPEEDEVPGRNPVLVLAHRTWREAFGSSPAVVGSTVRLNAQPFTVVGVAPRSLDTPVVFGAPAAWAPSMAYELLAPPDMVGHFHSRRALITVIYGRLKPGMTVEAARAQLQTIGKALEQEHPVENAGRNVDVVPLAEAQMPPQQRAIFVGGSSLLMGVVALVLLIACANVANLLLSRAMRRKGEIAIRLSLGASRGRLVRQLLAESLLLGLASAAVGLLLAWWGRSAIWALRPDFLQGAQIDLSFDLRVLGFTFVVALLTSLIFGLAPAIQSTRPGVVESLKRGAGEPSGKPSVLNLRNLLVAGQVALSLVALIFSGLFLRSLTNATRIDPGFDAGRVGMMFLNTGAVGYKPPQSEQFFDQVIERVSGVQGVESAVLATNVPLGGGGFMRTVLVDGRDPKAENNGILTVIDPVGEGYLKTMGIPLLAGREFNELDRADSLYVAIFNEAAARQFWPGENAPWQNVVGQRFHFFGQDWQLEVVGVSKNAKVNTVGEDPVPYIYLPRRQHFNPAQALFVRAKDEQTTNAVLTMVRDQVRALERNLPINNVQTMDTTVRQSLGFARLAAGLLGVFGGLALALAMIGIYGVMSYAVGQRNREIGIRMALGAEDGSVVRMMLAQGMKLVAIGIGVGLAVGLAVGAVFSTALGNLLFGLSAVDPRTFTLTALILAAVAFVATLLPARRATAVDPVRALKAEA